MSERPFWVSILQWSLWSALMVGIYYVLDRARRKPAASGEEAVMLYPRSVLVLSVICLLMSIALVWLAFYVPADKSPWWAKAGFVVVLLASLHWVADCFVGRYVLSAEGLQYVGVYSGRRLFRWDELRSLKYAPNLRWFVLESSQGHVARVSTMMTGLPAFARLLMERARNVNIDAAAIPILKQTARGEPPSLWD